MTATEPGDSSKLHRALNVAAIGSVANMAIVPVGADGMICVYVSSSMHLAVDVMGTFTRGVAVQFRPVTPVRVHDSRPPA